MIELNRVVAVAEVEGPDAALSVVEGLDLDGYHLHILWPATSIMPASWTEYQGSQFRGSYSG